MKIASFDVDAQNGFTANAPQELPVPAGAKAACSELAAAGVVLCADEGELDRQLALFKEPRP